MSSPRAIQQIINELTADRKIIGECEQCGCSAPLWKWNLFYGDNFLEKARPEVDALLAQIPAKKNEFKELVEKSTNLAAKKSVEVNVGKIVEKIVPALPSFPYYPNDCRTLFEPIDYVIFDGLTKDHRVSQIHFVDVKTGSARLNDHQKQIKGAIEDKKLEFQLY